MTILSASKQCFTEWAEVTSIAASKASRMYGQQHRNGQSQSQLPAMLIHITVTMSASDARA